MIVTINCVGRPGRLGCLALVPTVDLSSQLSSLAAGQTAFLAAERVVNIAHTDQRYAVGGDGTRGRLISLVDALLANRQRRPMKKRPQLPPCWGCFLCVTQTATV